MPECKYVVDVARITFIKFTMDSDLRIPEMLSTVQNSVCERFEKSVGMNFRCLAAGTLIQTIKDPLASGGSHMDLIQTVCCRTQNLISASHVGHLEVIIYAIWCASNEYLSEAVANLNPRRVSNKATKDV
jgi:hypothetical protein